MWLLIVPIAQDQTDYVEHFVTLPVENEPIGR